jgi:hypothetical protein
MMPNPNRFNPRNKAVGEANTLLILASLKSGPKTMNELIVLSGLTRQTITNKIKANKNIRVSATRPIKYYLGDHLELSTIPDEVIKPTTKSTKVSTVSAAIVHAPEVIVFFPKATHHDHSRFHDHIINSDENNGFMVMYRSVGSTNDLLHLEHQIKTMYDLVQFRKTLKEFE